MRLGSFHKKKRFYINKIKINFLSFLFRNKINNQIKNPVGNTGIDKGFNDIDMGNWRNERR